MYALNGLRNKPFVVVRLRYRGQLKTSSVAISGNARFFAGGFVPQFSSQLCSPSKRGDVPLGILRRPQSGGGWVCQGSTDHWPSSVIAVINTARTSSPYPRGPHIPHPPVSQPLNREHAPHTRTVNSLRAIPLILPRSRTAGTHPSTIQQFHPLPHA